MARSVRTVEPLPPYRNGIYPHRSFGRRRWVRRPVDLADLAGTLVGYAVAFLVLAIVLIGLVYFSLAVGNAVSSSGGF